MLGLVLERLFQGLWWVKLAEGWCKASLTVIHTGFLRSLACLNLLMFAGITMIFVKSVYGQYQVVNLNKHSFQ